MRVSCIAFTERGYALAGRIAHTLSGCSPEGEGASAWDVSVSRGFGEGKVPLALWTARAWEASDALLFVGAVGIAVRAVAPHVASKASDPAVVAIDEAGRFSVALLSGHLGGANDFALAVAHAAGATPIVTAATDARGVWAVDTWARRAGLAVSNPEAIKRVSARLLAGGRAALYSDVSISGQPPEGVDVVDDRTAADVVVSPFAGAGASVHAAEAGEVASSPTGAAGGPTGVRAEPLRLVPRSIACGIGCRRGIAAGAVEEAISLACERAGIFPVAVDRVASIDVKAHEAGLLAFCEAHDLPFRVYPADELALVAGSVSPSAFVRDTVGVDNVCERAALAEGGALVLPKFAHGGVTVAFAQVKVDISFEEGV